MTGKYSIPGKTILLFFLAAVGWTAAAGAETIRVPQDYPTIQQALDAASPGDAIQADPGIYNESLVWPDKEGIVLSGRSAGPADTIVEAVPENRVLTAQPREFITASIRGITFRYGESDATGGGLLFDSMDIRLQECIVSNNSSIRDGGGAFFRDSTVLISGCIFENNRTGNDYFSGDGTGIYLTGCWALIQDTLVRNHTPYYADGAGVFADGDTTIERCRFERNQIIHPGNDGSAVSGRGSFLRILNSVFLSNNGGSSAVFSAAGQNELTNLLFSDNESPASIRLTGPGEISFCTLAYNSTGIAISSAQASASIINSIFYSNETGIDRQSGSVANDYNTYSGNRTDRTGLAPGPHEFSADPLFTSLDDMMYLLSQTDSGQPDTSPCVDAANPESMNPGGTTRTDSGSDTGIADIGFHYNAFTPPSPTPTAIPSTTPLPSPTPVPERRMIISTNKQAYISGDYFTLNLMIDNPFQRITGDLYIVLDLGGSYYFWPDWCPYPDCTDHVNVIVFENSDVDFEILAFHWPMTGFSLQASFHAALTETDTGKAILYSFCSFTAS